MKKSIMYLFARTPVHVGAGNSVGAVDSPVMRERHTRIPIIPGSSLKGTISDLWNETVQDKNGKDKIVRSAEGKLLFGEEDNSKDAKAGSLLIGEARVLAFPVRSAKNMFAWITCPLVLNRYARDAGVDFDALPELGEMDCLAGEQLAIDNYVILEEYSLQIKGKPNATIIDSLKSISKNDSVWKGISEQLVILSNAMFSHFVEYSSQVVTRIAIDDITGVVKKGALFSLEQVPSETMFYGCIASQIDDGLQRFHQKLIMEQFIQIGGDSTTGLGICSVIFKEVEQ